MFKQLFTLVRGTSVDASQAFLDANAVALLRQQMRDAAEGVARSRKAVAVVMAYAEKEKRRLTSIEAKITELETRALDALSKDRDDLAQDAAQAIAELEAERDATCKTIETYDREIAVLRRDLKNSEAQLAELKRGQRLAEATAKTQHVRGSAPALNRNDLSDAAATLKRLQERQTHADDTMVAMAELSLAENADAVNDRLAEAGMGSAKRSTADDVLARLKNARS
ncbi:PspA/IM30 family protein [Marivita sp. S0852]|uniref:PspA/IM30 family protein n=1 Tax=Marivita sp. S0852 TaxID=3373893 RepID=UPI003981F250